MLNSTLCSLPLLTDLDSTVKTWKSLPSAFAPKSRQRDSNSLGRFESDSKSKASYMHPPTCPQYRLMIIAEHGCTKLSILLATCHVAKWYCMNCILEVRWPGSRMPHRYVLRNPLFCDTTETPSRLQSSSLPSKPVNGSSTHMALQNHRKCTTPTQLKFNYHMTSPHQSSKTNNLPVSLHHLSWLQWIFLSFFTACEFCQLPQFCTSKSFNLSSTQGAESILAHQNLLDDTVDRWTLAKPLLNLVFRSWIASFYRVVYIPGRSGFQETINCNYLPIRRFKRHRPKRFIVGLPQSTDVAGQLCPSASGDLKRKKQKSDYKTREMKKYDTGTQEKLIHKIRI